MPPGVETIRALLKHAVRRGIPILSLYAFSRENWARTDEEVSGLFALLEWAIRDETDELRRQGVRIRLLGRLEELPEADPALDRRRPERDRRGERLLLNIAFNYAGRTEIVDAVRRIVASGIAAGARSTSRRLSDSLYTAGLPDPDLVIRTGGDQRMSNFLVWQAAYAEFYFCSKLWPDFDSGAFDDGPGRLREPAPPVRPVAGEPVQERGRSALLFVPPLVLIVILGGWWITLAVIALTILAGIEVFRLLKLGRLPGAALARAWRSPSRS